MECPRCHGRLEETQIAQAGEGAYRGIYLGAHRCPRCRVIVMSADTHERRNGARGLAQTMLARASSPIAQTCVCLASLTRVTLSWHDAWLEIEECPRCGTLVFDDGELDRVRALLVQSSRLA